ncbi:MAG: alanine dehydrogenase, partial [bacterium]|nr:alanine dehydrogenase [bacterium]
MIIGVPRETKSDEYRVSLLPVGVDLLVGDGHSVLVQAG